MPEEAPSHSSSSGMTLLERRRMMQKNNNKRRNGTTHDHKNDASSLSMSAASSNINKSTLSSTVASQRQKRGVMGGHSYSQQQHHHPSGGDGAKTASSKGAANHTHEQTRKVEINHGIVNKKYAKESALGGRGNEMNQKRQTFNNSRSTAGGSLSASKLHQKQSRYDRVGSTNGRAKSTKQSNSSFDEAESSAGSNASKAASSTSHTNLARHHRRDRVSVSNSPLQQRPKQRLQVDTGVESAQRRSSRTKPLSTNDESQNQSSAAAMHQGSTSSSTQHKDRHHSRHSEHKSHQQQQHSNINQRYNRNEHQNNPYTETNKKRDGNQLPQNSPSHEMSSSLNSSPLAGNASTPTHQQRSHRRTNSGGNESSIRERILKTRHWQEKHKVHSPKRNSQQHQQHLEMQDPPGQLLSDRPLDETSYNGNENNNPRKKHPDYYHPRGGEVEANYSIDDEETAFNSVSMLPPPKQSKSSQPDMLLQDDNERNMQKRRTEQNSREVIHDKQNNQARYNSFEGMSPPPITTNIISPSSIDSGVNNISSKPPLSTTSIDMRRNHHQQQHMAYPGIHTNHSVGTSGGVIGGGLTPQSHVTNDVDDARWTRRLNHPSPSSTNASTPMVNNRGFASNNNHDNGVVTRGRTRYRHGESPRGVGEDGGRAVDNHQKGDSASTTSSTGATSFNGAGVTAAVGLATAATAGAVILGPVGLLVGAATVGIGVGLTQIPEEQRDNLREKATSAIENAHNKAKMANETLSSSCAVATSSDDDRGERQSILPSQFPCGGGDGGACASPISSDMAEMESLLLRNDTLVGGGANATTAGGTSSMVKSPDQKQSRSVTKNNGDLYEDGGIGGGLSSDNHSFIGETVIEQAVRQMENVARPSSGNRRIACLRKNRIAPIGQIHSMDPSRQPRAWFDVVASALTTDDEKNEAMEEILILAKDKNHAHLFLEEGMLDALMYILSNFFRKYSADNSNNKSAPSKTSADAMYHAKLAAKICVALGKGHCAAVHTEGDLHLMSSYNRGVVPVERQLAQMLHEVPHYRLISGSSPGQASGEEGAMIVRVENEVFSLAKLTMHESEVLAKSVNSLIDGKVIPWNMQLR